MGCCASSGRPQLNNISNTSNIGSPLKQHPLPEDEETIVKEVLSETPALHLPKPNISRFPGNDPAKKPMPPLFPYLRYGNDGGLKKSRMVFNPSDEFSEASSEIEKMEKNRGYDHDDSSKIRQSSPVKYQKRQLSGGERLVGKSPARRSEPSPGRVMSGSCRNVNATTADRRSRSPVTRVDGSGSRTGLDRCSSARGMGKSPGRVGSELSGKIRKGTDGNSNRENKLSPMTSNESLENPLVSLECFIFL